MACHGMPRHAKAWHGMPWHAKACFSMLWHALACFGMLWHAIPSIPSKKSLCSALSVPLRGWRIASGRDVKNENVFFKALCSALSVPLRGCVPCRFFVFLEKTTFVELFTEAGGRLVPGGLEGGAPQRMCPFQLV